MDNILLFTDWRFQGWNIYGLQVVIWVGDAYDGKQVDTEIHITIAVIYKMFCIEDLCVLVKTSDGV